MFFLHQSLQKRLLVGIYSIIVKGDKIQDYNGKEQVRVLGKIRCLLVDGADQHHPGIFKELENASTYSKIWRIAITLANTARKH